jgi:tRNA 2-thiouridine synthesizing protein A
VVDARGHRCPTPTLRLRRALERAAHGEVVELIADDPMARIDVPHFARESGNELVEIADQAGVMRFWVRKGMAKPPPQTPSAPPPPLD